MACVARFNRSKPPVFVFACAPSEPDMVAGWRVCVTDSEGEGLVEAEA